MDRTPDTARSAPAPWWPVVLVPALGLALAACGAVLVAGPSAGGDPAASVGLAAAALGCAVVVAWTVTAALAVLAVLAGRHRWDRLGGFCRRCSPAVLRRAATAALGVQLIAAPGAVADDAPSPFWTGGGSAQVAPAPVAGPPAGAGPSAGPGAPGVPSAAPGVPAAEAPSSGAPPAGAPHPSDRTVDGAVTVLRGDTLWSLAAAHLGPGASAEQIARAWPEWYALNRHVLPDGPHRLLPGQQLLVPGDRWPVPAPTPAAPSPGGPS